ncbi:HAMP domain-containing histidine kinase [Flavobacterium sp. AC]|uniref:histidine kinase n=1 Tax=Flavobacterium azizsancarii TaxID=2961580 RepID=A0ABT4WDE5_9FLAO|nr:ATP-binding protein [Flavobacterium azizsancarii]MDA6070262.1 HAMP domain-containing histidine kinase [Flavobacterium azizsancarii]
MNLKNKLAVNSTLLFAFIVGLLMAGSFLLFRSHMKDLYFDNLEDHAMTAALFYFEKDEIKEMNSARYQQIELQYKRINNESIRIYDAKTNKIYIKDTIDFQLSDKDLENIKKEKLFTFTRGKRQFVALFYTDNQGDFIIVVSGIDRAGNKQVEILGLMFILFYLVGIPLNYLLGTFLARQTFRPFTEVIAKVNTITTENLHSRLEIPQTNGKNEIKELATTFNYLLERLESGIMIQNNFLKNASHELKTPLTIIIGDIDVSLQQPRTNKQYEEILKSLRKDTLHLKATLEGLLVLSGLELSEPQQMETVRIDEILWNVLEKKAIEYPESKVSVDVNAVADHEHLLSVHANKHMLFIALYNILDNAVKFSSPAPVEVFALLNEGKLMIKITDQGPGISEEDKQSIFDLFFRSDNTRHIQGQGLGLYITMQILKLHNINLTVDSELGKGTSFSLVFP